MIKDPRDNAGVSVPVSRPRPRFGLKTLFVVLTLVCILLGWRMARQRAAAGIIARDRAVRDFIDRNFSTEPEGTSFKMPANVRNQSSNLIQRNRTDSHREANDLGAFFSGGRYNSTAMRSEPLDVSKLLAAGDATAAGAQIIHHYEHGLAEMGLRPMVQGGGEKTSAIWQLPKHGLDVIIDVDLNTERSVADVRVIILHDEVLSIW